MNLYDILKQKNKKQSPNAALPINFEERLREFAPPDSDDGDHDPEEILFRLAKQWWLGTESDMIRVERTLASMGWEIGEDEGSYDDGGVFVVRAGDVNGHSYQSWPHEELVMDESGLLGFLQPEQPKSKKTTPLSVMRREFEKEKPTPVPNVIQNKDANEKNAREVHRKYADEGMAEGNTMVKHRIGLTVTDPNHPMVSKRDEPIQKTVRVPGDDAAKAIKAAIAHYRRKGYKVHDHHYMGTVEHNVMDEAAPDWLRHTAGAATGALAGVGASFPGAAIAGPVGGAVAGAYGAKSGYELGTKAADWVYDKVTGKKIPADKAAVDEELTMKHQRDHDTQRRPDISNSLADRGFDMSEKPNVAKSADGHPTVKWRHHGHAGHSRVEPTLRPTTVDRKDARPIPSFLKKDVAEGSLNEFAPSDGGGDSGNYFQALASAWYNGTFDSGSLEKGIKSQEDVERLLNRGIVCPDGKTRKLHIDYNSDFDGVEIYSDDYYEHGDESGELDSRTGQPWGPYDYMEFGGEELDESAKWRDPKYKDQLYTQEKPDYNDTREYDRARWDPKPKGYKGRKEPLAGGEFPRTDPLVKGFGRYGVGEPVSKGPRKGLPSRDQITSLKGSIKDAHGKHHKPNLPEQGVVEGKADYNFDIEDLKRLERIRDLAAMKAQALALISKPSAKPMKPEKVEWFKNALERMNSPMKVIKLMYDLLLSGEGNAVVGTRSSMNPNSYRQRFGEQGVAEGHADQQRKIFKKNGHPVGEVGIDRESSPGNGQWYMKYYATGDDFGGYDSMEEAVADLKHLVNQFKAEGVAEGLNEFAPDGFNGGDDDEGFSPEIAKMAQEDGFTKGAGLADGATLERAITINHWHSTHGGMYKQYFAKGFKAGRLDKIRHNNKQYNLNLKLMKDGSIRHGEQGVAEGEDKYAELSKKIQDLAQAGKEREANKLRYELNRLLMLDRDKKRRQERGVAEGMAPLSVQQLATISDEALDKAYGYGRSTPGNTFGWQANLKSAAYAKKMIDKGVTDIEAISDAIHKGWNTTAQAFVQNPDQFDDTAKLQAAGKLEAKLQQRAQLMKQNYAQLPEEEKEKDRVVARALLQAIKGEQGVEEAIPLDKLRSTGTRVKDEVSAKLKQNGPLGRDAEKAKQNGKSVNQGVAEGLNKSRSECANIILHHTRNIDIDGDHDEGKLSGGALRHVLGQKSPTFDQLSNEYGGDYHDMVRHANLDDLQQIAQDFTGGIAEGGYNDYDNNRKGFGRDNAFRNQERNAGLEGETNNIQISINGKPWKVIPCRGYADSKEEWSYLQNMKEWAAKKSAQTGKKWTVSLTGAPLSEDIAEHIGKVKDGYRLYSHTGKNLGTFGSKAGAEKHEREVQYFKHLGEDNLSELSNDLLGQYKKAAGISARDFDRAGKYSKADKRFKGIVKATVKQFDNDLKKHKTEDLTVKSADSTSPVGGGAFMESYIQDLKRAGYDI